MKPSHRSGEKGVALIITMFLMAAMSALAVSLMFLSQTETSASRNYKTMSQARYAGEAGVHKAIHYFLNSYSRPTSTTGYTTNVSPVQYNGAAVVLKTVAAQSNYPDTAVKDAFAAAAAGSLAVGTGTVNYTAEATLLSMRDVNVYGGGSGVVQTWEIKATGTVPGAIPATVEVTATLERDIADAQTFAVFATGAGCGAITLSGNVETASYDSRIGTATSDSGGNVGTNGNMSISGSVEVHGSLSTPRTGVGSCTAGAVTALTESGHAEVDGNNLIQLPQAINFETPALPSPLPPTGTTNTCGAISVTLPATCTTISGKIHIDPMGTTVRLGNITSGQFVLHGGSYAINSITGASGTKMEIADSLLGDSKVVIDLVGKTPAGGDMATVYDTSGNGFTNSSMDPSRLQIRYAGTGAIEMTGASDAAFMVYAPNASITTHGNADIWGSVLGRQVTSSGTPRFIYDRALQSSFYTMGNYVMSSFSWKKY